MGITMKVTYDGKSFKLDDRKIWIVAGEIHYFRHPNSEWREVLLRAKRAGLNTICTYVPWNFHETTEGSVDFEGDKNLARYIDLIGELGMYAMLRPGPYICSEWDGGGIPAWLCAKPVLRFREDDPVYMAAVESWFDKLIPIISERQITRGGPVLTVQNENEYPGGWDESMRRYIKKLSAILKKHDIEVPIVACNVHGDSETTVRINDSIDDKDQIVDSGMILTYNHHVVVEPVKDLKSKQPDSPLITTEFWSGAPISWGDSVSDWPHRLDLARAAYEYASYGTQICYYMFEGGTNFGFWGGNNIATSYASGYPVGEAGKLTDKYYAVRPVNLFASCFGNILAESEEREDKAGLQASDGVRLVVRDNNRGAIAFVSVHDERKEISMVLPEGKQLTVHFGEVAASVLPVRLEAFDGVTIDYSNLALLAKQDSNNVLILYGPAGTEGVLSLNGREITVPVSRREVEYREAEGIRVLVADEEMARRCWIVGDQIVFGPDYVAKASDDGALDIKVSEATPEVVYLDVEGKLVRRPYKHATIELKLPELSSWSMAPSAEVFSDRALGWTTIDDPRSHEKLGVVQGYLWYSAELDCAEDGVEKLLLTHAPNRISVFVNGQFCGTHAAGRSVRMRDDYAHPADWAFEELTVQVKRGRNRFVFLSDDQGHNYDVPIPTGIQGPVFLGSRRVEIDGFRDIAPVPVTVEAFQFLYSRFYREPEPLPAAEFEFEVKSDEQAFIVIHGVHAWLTVNGDEVPPLSFPESPWTMFAQIKRWLTWQLPDSASGRSNTVRIQYSENVPHAVQENMAVYVVPKSGELKGWQWKRWEESGYFSSSEAIEGAKKEKAGQLVLLPVGGRLLRKGRKLAPSHFKVHFPMPEGERPVYLNIGEMQKGQIYLNGHNAGRFWAFGGTQQLYYLPKSWMNEENELVIFEELGLFPQNVSLVFGESGRWTSVSLQTGEIEVQKKG